MFALCMSRGHPIEDAQNKNISNKPVKGGYLLRYKRGLFCKSWCEEWVVLYEDSTLAWFADKDLGRPRGCIQISKCPELLAVGEWTRQVPRRPRFPSSCHIGQLLAIGSKTLREVHWLMGQSPAEINDWMTAISNTLPPPPHLPLDDKRLSLTMHKDALCINGNGNANQQRCLTLTDPQKSYNNGTTSNLSSRTKDQNGKYDADHTVLSGVVIDWGHGWGWGQNAWAAQTACAHDAAVSSSIYCQMAEDYGIGGYDEVDWSAFGDFSF